MAEVFVDAAEIVAYHPKVRAELKRRSRSIAREARQVLAAHRNEGHSFIELRHFKLDYYITLNDTRGLGAAAAIEFGSSRSVAVAPLAKAISAHGINATTRRSAARRESARLSRPNRRRRS